MRRVAPFHTGLLVLIALSSLFATGCASTIVAENLRSSVGSFLTGVVTSAVNASM